MERPTEQTSTTHSKTVIENHHVQSKKEDKHIQTADALLSLRKDDKDSLISKSAPILLLDKDVPSFSSTGCKQVTLTSNYGKK